MSSRKPQKKSSLMDFFERWYPTIEKYWRLLNPKTYRAMSWLCVTLGVAVLGSPIWLPLFEALVSEYLGFGVRLQSPIWVGVFLIFAGMAFALLNNWIMAFEGVGKLERKTQEAEHDLKILKDVFSIMDEKFLEWFEYFLLGDHSYRSKDVNRFSDLDHCLNKASFVPIDEDLQNAFCNLKSRTGRLLVFLGLKFFVYPENQSGENYRFVMQPALNVDRAGTGEFEDVEKYDKLAEELEGIYTGFRDAYRELIEITKNKFPSRFFEIFGETKDSV